MEFKEKLASINFGKIQTKKVTHRDTGEVAGEHRKHLSGRVDAVVTLKAENVSTQKIDP